MSRSFDIPLFYRSPIISVVKKARRTQDRYKKDLSPSILDLGKIRFKLGRHFGFCFGVENAIDIAYKAIRENPGRRIFLISEMIHNPHVNDDLQKRGVRFMMNTDGSRIIELEDLGQSDVVIIPAFGTTREIFNALEDRDVKLEIYNTTCPFVEKVWNRSAQIGKQGYSVIIHGRNLHEETRATFSHASLYAPCLVVRDIKEAQILADFITHKRDIKDFDLYFENRYSQEFIPNRSLEKIGVVNQTTMLASETREISLILEKAVTQKYGKNSFADTRDTLCYATSENQDATNGLIESGGDLAIVVGGYNSSNTSHLVELLEEKMPTYYIQDENEIISKSSIKHLDIHTGEIKTTSNWLDSERQTMEILVTSGASCPDALVDLVIEKVALLMNVDHELEKALLPFEKILQDDSN